MAYQLYLIDLTTAFSSQYCSSHPLFIPFFRFLVTPNNGDHPRLTILFQTSVL
jgi:hypothetical protein